MAFRGMATSQGSKVVFKMGENLTAIHCPKRWGDALIYIYITIYIYILVECFFGDAILILGVFLFLDATFSILIFIFYSQNPGGL